MNYLYYGDNLDILREYIKDKSVDLIYLDPPFNSKRDYNVLFKEKNGTESAAQIKAFTDYWHWDEAAEKTLSNIVESAPKVMNLINGLIDFLGRNDLTAYLVMMTIRIVEFHRALKDTGSLYLHCDPTASHYLKIILDVVFGKKNIRNEIIWHYRRWTGTANRFLSMHDVILFYTKRERNYTFNPLYTPYTEKSLKRKQHYHTRIKGDEVYVTSINEKGIKENDVWIIPIINPQAKERLGYPTQKPEALLERIILASSNEGDVILDPFCGCGTSIAMAEKLNRRWIGIDVTYLAISLIKRRLENQFIIKKGKGELEFKEIGQPADIESAKHLAYTNRYEFQRWAVDLVRAWPYKGEKRGADEGIDGIVAFQDDNTKRIKKIIIQVKSGHVGVKDIRELIQVVNKNNAQIGAFITLENPTRPMVTEALSQGCYESPIYEKKYPKIQILTIEKLLKGKELEYPPATRDLAFKKAEKYAKTRKMQEKLDF